MTEMATLKAQMAQADADGDPQAYEQAAERLVALENEHDGQFFVPSQEWVDGLQVGDTAPDCFGNPAEVVQITFRGVDTNGTSFVGVYLQHGSGSVSETFKVGTLHRTLSMTQRYTSQELREIEAERSRHA